MICCRGSDVRWLLCYRCVLKVCGCFVVMLLLWRMLCHRSCALWWMFGHFFVRSLPVIEVVLVFANLWMPPSSSPWNAHCVSIIWLSSRSWRSTAWSWFWMPWQKLCLAFVGVDNGCVPEHSSPCWGMLLWPPNLFSLARRRLGELPMDRRTMAALMSLPSWRYCLAWRPQSTSAGSELVDIRVFLVYFFKKVSTA
jgi:hypothetical protein